MPPRPAPKERTFPGELAPPFQRSIPSPWSGMSRVLYVSRLGLGEETSVYAKYYMCVRVEWI